MSALANELPQSSNPEDEQDVHKASDSDLAPVESVREDVSSAYVHSLNSLVEQSPRSRGDLIVCCDA